MNEERTQPRRPHDPERYAADEGEGRQGAADAAHADHEPEVGTDEAQRDDATDARAQGRAPDEVDSEADILRGELATLQERLAEAEREAREAKDRALRARAELDTVRRRAESEEARAREGGVDAALAPAIQAFDDLRRALAAAESGDPQGIVPGVRAVMEGLERNLDQLDIRRIGEVGETFDPGVHEALTSAPTQERERSGTIADVFEVGFERDGRLIRPARVVVYQAEEA
ncbi:MAG: nucleotide exchange factor GrpE [Trueperaceae bacterium]|nr:nucleotide exchange factor GrpE [Trueperaceae bacterium]